jgi:hypothetical protein
MGVDWLTSIASRILSFTLAAAVAEDELDTGVAEELDPVPNPHDVKLIGLPSVSRNIISITGDIP